MASRQERSRPLGIEQSAPARRIFGYQSCFRLGGGAVSQTITRLHLAEWSLTTIKEQILYIPQIQRIPHVQHHDHADEGVRGVEVSERIFGLARLSRLASSSFSGHPFESALQEDAPQVLRFSR